MEIDDPDGIGWDVPGWDWPESDWSWLASHSGKLLNGMSVFFIHGGRIREQSHMPTARYPLDEFFAEVHRRADHLDSPLIVVSEEGCWVEGTRPPNEEDRERLRWCRERQERDDRENLALIQKRHPDWFAPR